MISEVSIKLLVLLSSLLLGGCFFPSASQEIQEIKGEIFGSYYLIKFRGELNQEKFKHDLDEFFTKFNNEFSTYQNDSVISQLNRYKVLQKMQVSSSFIEMLKLAEKFHKETNGAFDPTLGPVIKAWGFGGGKTKKVPTKEELKKALSRVGFQHMKWDEAKLEVWKTNDLELDVNAFAPGWAADLIGKLLETYRIKNYMVDISGEILFKGDKGENLPWIAGIEVPTEKQGEAIQRAFKIKNLALATSGNYRQFFYDNGEVRSHILSPKTGLPVNNGITSASVISTDAATSDAWGTALMVLGEDGIELAEKHGIKVLLLKAKKPQVFEEITSPGMKSYLRAQGL